MISSETGKVTPLLLLRIFEARDEFSLFGAYLRSANFRHSPAVGKTWSEGPIQPDVTDRAIDDREK